MNVNEARLGSRDTIARCLLAAAVIALLLLESQVLILQQTAEDLQMASRAQDVRIARLAEVSKETSDSLTKVLHLVEMVEAVTEVNTESIKKNSNSLLMAADALNQHSQAIVTLTRRGGQQ